MDQKDQIELDWTPFVFGGIMGGLIGSLLIASVGAIYIWRTGGEFLGQFLAASLGLGLIGGAIAGIAVGYVIFSVTKRQRKQPGHALRFAIGAGCLLAAYTLLHPPRSKFDLLFNAGFALVVGGLAGLTARAKTSLDSNSVAADT